MGEVMKKKITVSFILALFVWWGGRLSSCILILLSSASRIDGCNNKQLLTIDII